VPQERVADVLSIEPSARKSWRVAFRANNRWRRMNIGAVSLMDLATARNRAREILGGVASGLDPADERRADREAVGPFVEICHRPYSTSGNGRT
jgi:hypothetical protein